MSVAKTDKSLRILMLASVPFFSHRGTPISIRLRLEDLSKLGHEVDLVTYPVGQNVELPGLRILRTINIPSVREVPVGPSFKKLVLNILIFFKALGLLISNRYDLIHTHEECSYFGTVFSKIFRVRHLYDFHSSLPQAMKNFGYEKHRRLISVLEYFEKHVLRSCSGVITISKDLSRYIENINNKIPSVIIENFKSYDFKPKDNKPSESYNLFKSELNGHKVVLYSGTFEHYQGLGLLLDAAELLIKTHNNTIFVLAGGRKNQIDNLKTSADRRGMTDYFHFTGNLEFDELVNYMHGADLLISTRVIGNNPPLKIYDYLGVGKPIVATNISAHTQILNDNIAVLVEAEPKAIAKGITSILDDESYAQELAKNSKEFFDENYSPKDRLEKTSKFLNDVMMEKI